MSDVDKIKDSLSIVDIVGRYLELKKAGINYAGLCPFHNEKTPSFYVSPERGTFKCFGCGEGGDIFTFLEKVEGLEFREALVQLASEAGVTLEQTPTSTTTTTEKDSHLAVLDWARYFWQHKLLSNTDALAYLKKRGFSKQMLVTYATGYAPDAWTELYDFLRSKNITEEQMIEVGLVKQGERGTSYDRFRHRIIFPLRNSAGKTVAFSGRYLGADDKQAKYLNSPETAVFNKSRELYGLDTAKQAIRKNNFVIVVEGQVDLIMSQSVFLNTVATSGTSLTREHLQSLRRFTDRIIFVFDNDEAGTKAAFRASLLALSLDFEVKIAELAQGSDPADIIVENPDEYRDIVKKSRDVFEYWLHHIVHKEVSGRERNKQVEEILFPLLAIHSNQLEQDRYIQLVSSKMGLSSESLRSRIAQQSKQPSNPLIENSPESPNEIAAVGDTTMRHTPLERLALVIYWQNSLPETDRLIDIETSIYGQVDEETRAFLGHLLEKTRERTDKEDELFEIEKLYQNSIMLQNDIDELIANLSTYRSKEHQQNLMQQYQQAKLQGKTEEAHRLLQELQKNITRYGN